MLDVFVLVDNTAMTLLGDTDERYAANEWIGRKCCDESLLDVETVLRENNSRT